MKKAVAVLCAYIAGISSVMAEVHDRADTVLPERDLLVRVGVGAGFANQAGTGESAWYGPKQKGSCGFQYNVDVLNYHRGLGYGMTFRHYLHDRNGIGAGTDALDEDVQIMYVAPQFSNVSKSLFFEGLTSNIDLGIGYAHYKSAGSLGQTYSYDTAASGFGVNVNIGIGYQVTRHLSARLAVSGEFYWFYNLHEGNDYSSVSLPFGQRDKLKPVMIVPQLSVAYHF